MRKLVGLFLMFGMIVRASAGPLDTWTNVANFTNGDFNQVIYANGLFVASASGPAYLPNPGNAGGIATSPDGVTWTMHTTHDNVTGIAFGNGVFVASESDATTDGDGGELLYSTNGTTWTPVIGPPGMHGVAFGGGVFVAVGYIYESQQGYIMISRNGRDWTNTTAGTNFLSKVAYGNGQFLAGSIYAPGTGGQKAQIIAGTFVGTNGDLTWSAPQSTVLPATLASLNFVNGQFYAALTSGAAWRYSTTNGLWSSITGPAPMLYSRLSSTNNSYITVGASGALYSATSFSAVSNSFNWVSHSTGTTGNLTSVAYNNTKFAIVGAGGTVLASDQTNPLLIVPVPQTNGEFISVSGGVDPKYNIQVSTNLITWSNLYVYTNSGITRYYLDPAATNSIQRYYRLTSF